MLSSSRTLVSLILSRISVIVEAVAINIIGVDFVNISSVPGIKIPATSRSRINQARPTVVRQKVRIYEFAVDHILNPITLKFSVLERHYAIAYQNAFQIDFL